MAERLPFPRRRGDEGENADRPNRVEERRFQIGVGQGQQRVFVGHDSRQG